MPMDIVEPAPGRTHRWLRPPSPPTNRKLVAVAILVMLLVIGLIETAQYVFVDILPKSYDHVSDIVEALVIFALIVLLVRWRRYALYGEELVGQLRQAERWREDMTAMLVHDLKNPVVSSALALQAVLRRQTQLGTLSEKELEYLRMARQAQVRLSAMIGDLLAVAQAENGQMALQIEQMDLGAIVAGVVAEMAPQAAAATLELRQEGADSVLLEGDGPRLRRVVENLLANAIKFTPPGGSVHVGVTSDDGHVLLRVSDTGPGVPLEARGRIFEKFGQAAAGQRMSIGLGLAFCKLVAEAHGGSITVESRQGEGSTFIVSLPSRQEVRRGDARIQVAGGEAGGDAAREGDQHADDTAHRAGDDRP